MQISSEVTGDIRKYALKNAVEYGKAHEGSVLNKIISLYPEHKPDIKALAKEVAKIIGEVNSLDKEMLQAEYAKYAQEFEDERRIKEEMTAKPKFVLEGVAEGDFIGRASPEPSGYAHMGHVKQVLLNEAFAKAYNGKLYLFFDDTNPEKAKQEYVDAIRRDFEWLGVKFDREYYASDNIEKIYAYARQLIGSARAYVCQCSRDEMKQYRMEGTGCRHREQDAERNISLFEDMVAGRMDEGTAIVRLKGDMSAQNAVMRDPALLRIVKTPHYRQGTKYFVWPLYDFNTPILDSVNGVTDIIRDKNYEPRDELVREILGALGLRIPRMHLEGRLNIKGNVVQKRVIRKLISDGLIKSWDDPRLMTVMALRRRGVQVQALRDFVLRFGMSKTESEVGIDMLLAENKKIIDPLAKHLFFVENPAKVAVNGAAASKVRLRIHPSNDFGFREYQVNDTFYISGADAMAMSVGDTVRLKDLMAIKIVGKAAGEIAAQKAAGTDTGKIVQWVCEGNYSRCSVAIPGDIIDDKDNFLPNSLKVVNGYVESYATMLNEHDIVQFERFGYCILDKKATLEFIFISK